jgi:hypothetical protein
MCDGLVWSFDAITSINWLEVIKALAPVATAVIAFLALKNWQRQDKAKREAEFLDALIEAAHTYIAAMPKPITLLEMAKIGMASHAPTGEGGEQADIAVKGAIAYMVRGVPNRLVERSQPGHPHSMLGSSTSAKQAESITAEARENGDRVRCMGFCPLRRRETFSSPVPHNTSRG